MYRAKSNQRYLGNTTITLYPVVKNTQTAVTFIWHWRPENSCKVHILLHTLAIFAKVAEQIKLLFNMPRYASCRVSVTHQYYTKTVKLRITQTTPQNSPRTLLVSWCQRSWQYSNGSSPTGDEMQVRKIKIGHFQQITGYNSKKIQDRHIVFIGRVWSQ